MANHSTTAPHSRELALSPIASHGNRQTTYHLLCQEWRLYVLHTRLLAADHHIHHYVSDKISYTRRPN